MNQVHFGWGFSQHQAIENTAIKTLNDSHFKQLLKDDIWTVHRSSVDEDLYNPGQNHFISMEQVPYVSVKTLSTRERHFKNLDQVFIKGGQDNLDLNGSPYCLNHAGLTGFVNVYKASVDQYSKLVQLLKGVDKLDHDKDKKKLESLLLQIKSTVGKLAHYVSDLMQPMHSTQYFDWATPSEKSESAHFLFELFMKTEGEHLNWSRKQIHQFYQVKDRNRLSGKPIPVASAKQLFSQLRAEIINSYKTMFEVVDIDRCVRNKHGLISENASNTISEKTKMNYTDEVLALWEGIADQRMADAVTLVRGLLDRAYIEAGKPDF